MENNILEENNINQRDKEFNKNGLWIFKDKNGNIIQKGNYKEDKQDGLQEYWIYNENNICFSYSKIFCKDGNKNGISEIYHYNNLIQKMTWKDDLADGLFQCFWLNGNINLTGNYINNKKEGIWKTYSNDGELLEIIVFKNNMPVNLFLKLFYCFKYYIKNIFKKKNI